MVTSLAGPGKPVSLGVGDDGRTVYVAKGDEVQFTFVEYGGKDTWVMRSNPDVIVVSDLVRESYPMQHVITVKVLAPTMVRFDREAATDGGRTSVAYHIAFWDGPNRWPDDSSGSAYVPDPTFDIPPVIISRGSILSEPLNAPFTAFDFPPWLGGTGPRFDEWPGWSFR